MKVRIEFQGKEEDFNEINEFVGEILELPPFEFDKESKGYDKKEKKGWIEFSNMRRYWKK